MASGARMAPAQRNSTATLRARRNRASPANAPPILSGRLPLEVDHECAGITVCHEAPGDRVAPLANEDAQERRNLIARRGDAPEWLYDPHLGARLPIRPRAECIAPD